MARISEDVITEIIQKTDLVDLISEKVALSKKGKGYFGLCPFHHEKTASFSVEPEKKIYTCFSCGEKGNAITFKQKTDNLTFVDAVEFLAERANIDIDFSKFKKENPNQKYHDLNKDAKGFYKLFLKSTVQGQNAVKYLKSRGITDEIIEIFELGLSPSEFDLLYKTLTEKGYLVSDMFDLGLVKQSKKENFYDLFRNRIIFPIHNGSGNVIAFSGRIYQGESDAPKYVNSPQTVMFTKSRVLYNLHNAVQEIKKLDRVVLFEGYMDVIAAYRAGIKDAVASMGTSLTREQVTQIKRYTNNVTICYDGDKAGLAATARALEMFKNENMNVKIVLLPTGLDPDDYIDKYSEASLYEYINTKWISSIRFLYLKNKSDIDFTKMLDIERFKKAIFDLIKNESRTTIEVFIKDISEDVNISLESLRQDFQQYTRKNISKTITRGPAKVSIEDKYSKAERRLINYYLMDVKYLLAYNNEIGDGIFINSEVRDIKMQIEDIMNDNYHQKAELNIDREEFLKNLTEAQTHFFQNNVESKLIELSVEEYKDLMETMVEYLEELKKKDNEAKIVKAETLKEKIALAKERDKQIKEVKHGQGQNNSRVN